jgi:hypothetical protein
MHPNRAGGPWRQYSHSCLLFWPVLVRPGRVAFYSCLYDLSLGERFIASASSFSRGAEAEHASHTAEVKCLSGSYVDCVELVFRPAGQFVQVESRVPESRNRNPPKRRTIGELLKQVILTNHRSLRDVRLLGNAYVRRGWLECQIHRFNPQDRILRHLLCQGLPKCFAWFFTHRPLELNAYYAFDAFPPDHSVRVRQPRGLCYSELFPCVRENGQTAHLHR